MTSPGTGGPAAARRTRIRLALVLVGMVLSIAAGTWLFRSRQATMSDPRFCTGSCHVPKDNALAARPGGVDGWHSKGHEDVACQQCHTLREPQAFDLFWKKLYGAQKEKLPKHGKIEPQTCEHCHDKDPVAWRKVRETEGHRRHSGVKDVDCLTCHSSEVHKAEVMGEKGCTTANCHKVQRLHKNPAEAETCMTCHNFLAGTKKARPATAEGCLHCHADGAKMTAAGPAHGPGSLPLRVVDKESLHGKLDCKLCHEPHQRKFALPDKQPVCARCHQMVLFFNDADKLAAAPEGHKKCDGCHKPHAPRQQTLASCVDCHEKNAKGIFAAVGAARAAGKAAALQHESCASCHLPHTWKADKGGCADCHKDKAESIKTESPPQHAECTNCHAVHGAPPSAATCVGCHKTKAGHVSVAPGKHKECTSCHNPHAANKAAAKVSCANCHANELAAVGRGPQGHVKESCFGCHKQIHNSPKPPANVCGTCHDANMRAATASTVTKHKSCYSCHEGHKFSISDTKATCSKCHSESLKAGLGPHTGDCKSCHTLHGSPQIARTKCMSCHTKVQAAFKAPNDQHSRCASCHTPHHPVAEAPAKCASCHERQVTVAAKWPAKSAHAEACSKCHKPHDVKDKPTCAGCHKPEAQSAIAASGKHQCAQCHQPHKAPPGAGPAWWTTCNNCHDDKVKALAARGGQTHSKCENCHKPHGFNRGGCGSSNCHTDMSSKGVHAVKEHAAKCAACHDPHIKSEPTRQTCLASCHAKQKDHEPNAERCQACHPFK